MRIAHVTRSFLPMSQTFIHTQLRAQADLDQIVVTRRRVNAEAFPFEPVWALGSLGRQVERVAFRTSMRGLEQFPRQLVGPVREFGAQLLHAHFGWTGRDAVHAAERLELPLVTAFHGRDVYSPRHRPGGAAGLYDRLFAAGAAFTCVGPRAGDELVRQGCPRERLRIVPVGLDLADFPFAPAPMRRPLVVLQIARLVAKKGVDTAIRAFAAAARALGDAQLWIVGDGPDRDALQQLARDLGVADRVVFHGTLPPAQVRALISDAHLGVQPSRSGPDGDREGTPTVILEMQARGVDVVATDHADIPFIVPDPGELVPEGDADALAAELVRRAGLAADERTERLGAARALVERQHDANRIAVQLRAIYEEALSRSATRACSNAPM